MTLPEFFVFFVICCEAFVSFGQSSLFAFLNCKLHERVIKRLKSSLQDNFWKVSWAFQTLEIRHDIKLAPLAEKPRVLLFCYVFKLYRSKRLGLEGCGIKIGQLHFEITYSRIYLYKSLFVHESESNVAKVFSKIDFFTVFTGFKNLKLPSKRYWKWKTYLSDLRVLELH